LPRHVARRIIPLIDDPEKPRVWWTENEDGARRITAIVALVALILAVALFYSDIRNILGTRPWWQDTLAVLAAIALPVLAFFELRHSGEANTLRAEANRLRTEANDLQDQIGSLTAELAAERNKHLQQIAKNTQKPVHGVYVAELGFCLSWNLTFVFGKKAVARATDRIAAIEEDADSH
jgi:cell division protein FtsB